MSNTPVSPHQQSNRVSTPSKIGATSCMKCGGAGGSQHWPGYTCWRCSGNGMDPTYRAWILPASWSVEQCIEWDEKRLAKNARASERARARKQAALDLAVTEFMAEQDAVVAEKLQVIMDLPIEDRHEIANDIIWKLRRYASISAAQIELVFKVQAEHDERLAQEENDERPELAEGRYVVEGLVISTKAKDSQYGTQYKMLVELADGNRVFGTIPRSLDDQVWATRSEVTVQFTAAVQVSKDDEHFGFFSRPTKATVIETQETT